MGYRKLKNIHWHGAAPDSWFSHPAVEVPGVDGSNEWMEAVGDAVYGTLKLRKDGGWK